MTCFSCDHYRPAYMGDPAWCGKWLPGFPAIGQSCRGFSYEPGSDEREAVEAT